jgi:hypothetical protein
MVDNYAYLGVIIRSIAAIVLVLVLVKQIAQFKNKTSLQGLKRLLLATTLILFVGNLFAIFLNFFRGSDGNLIDSARHIGTIFNSTATLMVSVALYMIYKYRDNGKMR